MKRMTITLTSSPKLDFKTEQGFMHKMQFNKTKSSALSDMLKELIKLNYFNYGVEETDAVICEYTSLLKNA